MSAAATSNREEEVARLRIELAAMRRSLSWRVTKPLRSIAKFFRKDPTHLDPVLSVPASKRRALRISGEEAFSHFPPYTGPGTPGSYTDFLGVRTNVEFQPGVERWSGEVFGHPGEYDGSTEVTNAWARTEWIGTLKSVLEARGSLTVFELGAGWGPWLVAAAAAARRKGISKVRLVGVEGSKEHVDYMRRHFLDNGIDPVDHHLFTGVVGTYDGTAKFPKLRSPSDDYGAQAEFGAEADPAVLDDQRDCPKLAFDELEEVPCIALNTLLRQYSAVDLIHCDIQGAEGTVLGASIEELTKRVRRIVVGTHSRHVEAQLLDLFVDAGWTLETEEPCCMTFAPGRKTLSVDGVQVWRNDGV